MHLFRIPVVTFLALAFAPFLGLMPSSAQQPDTLRHSIPSPPVGAQGGGQLGFSVAVDETSGLAVAGQQSGAVKIFDLSTGALLHVLENFGNFGYSVAISGTRVAVGAYSDDTGAINAGRVYVYDLAGATPTVPVATLNNPAPLADDNFGNSVAISGTRVVVGANLDDAGAVDAGSAYVYDLASATPTVPVATLNNPNPAANDQFGCSVAVSGTRVVVGARLDDTLFADVGTAYVYDLAGATPTVPAVTLSGPDASPLDWFGASVAISGSRVIVGANGEDTGSSAAGSAYVFDVAGATPTVPVVTLNNPSADGSDYFGFSVAISGTRVVVGARFDATGAIAAGSAYVFDVAGATPTVPVATLNNPTPAGSDFFGNSVAISGTKVLVGAPQDDTSATDAGSAYLYELSGAAPAVPVTRLNHTGPSRGDEFGYSVAISGTRMVVGARSEDTGATTAGSAYVYDLAGATPTVPVTTLNNPTPATNDQFGWSVAISGTRVVVGAWLDDTGATDAGSVYVYDLAGATPTEPVVTLHNPDPGATDYFGHSVAISGTQVVVGAYLDDTGASNAGSVYVYDLAGATPAEPVFTLNNPAPATSGQFGKSVAISGTRVAVGVTADDTGATDAGSAYVYDISGATPTVPVVTLYNPSPALTDLFGYSVAIFGSRVVVGVYGDDTGATDAGRAYVYDISGATPTVPVATLNNPSPAVNDRFGASVAISGTRVAVGAYLDNTGANDAGSAYVYDLAGATPTVPVATLSNPGPGVSEQFANSVSMDGDFVAIGTPGDDSPTLDKGSVYVFGPEITPPDTAITGGPSALTNNPGATITFTGSDNVTPAGSLVFQGRLDGADFATVSSPVTLTNLGEGSHSYEVRARDAAGNVDPTPASVTWTVDLTTPTGGTFSVTPSSPVKAGATLTGTFAAWSDASLPLKYQVRLQGGSSLTAESTDSAQTFILPDGTSNVFGRITDAAGNSIDTQPIAISADGVAPETTITRGPKRGNGTTSGATAVFTFSSSEPGGTFTYVLDDGAPVTTTAGSVSFTGLAAGTHVFVVFATDAVGNMDATPDARSWTAQHEPAFSAFGTKGDAVPNPNDNPAIQSGAQWTSFGSPAINDAGDVAVIGKWNAPAADPLPAQSGVGIFLNDTLVIKVGQAVPGAGTGSLPADATFKSFKDPVLDQGGHVAFLATIAGTGVSAANDGVVVSAGRTGALEVVAREGDEAAGTGGAVFSRFSNVAIQGDSVGGTLFVAALRGARGGTPVNAKNNEGAWWQEAGEASVSKVARKGDPGFSTGETIQSIKVLQAVSGSTGHGRGLLTGSSALLQLGLVAGGKPRQTLALAEPGTLTEVTSDTLGGSLDGAWDKMSLPSANHEGSEIAVLGTLKTGIAGVTKATAKGIFRSENGGDSWEPLARLGGNADALAPGALFSALGEPVCSSTGGGVAFIASVKGGTGVTAANNDAIWRMKVPGGAGGGSPSIEPLAREGGIPPKPSAGAQWKSFTSVAYPGGFGGPIFIATIKPAKPAGDPSERITAKNNLGIYAVDSLGNVQELLRGDQPLLGKKVKTFNVLKAVSGTAGSARSFNSEQQVVALVTFTDGATSIVKIDIP